MVTREELRELHDDHRALCAEQEAIQQRLQSQSFVRILDNFQLRRSLKKLHRAIQANREKFEPAVDRYLESDHSTYGALIRDNKDLLMRHEYLLRVYQQGSNGVSATEMEFAGLISEKGYLYLFVQRTDVPISSFSQNRMSKLFAGSFDPFGSFSARSIKRDFYFIPRIPEFFKAKCFEDLSFRMVASETSTDFAGNYFVDRMIGDPFHENDSDRHRFLLNRNTLRDIRTSFLESL